MSDLSTVIEHNIKLHFPSKTQPEIASDIYPEGFKRLSKFNLEILAKTIELSDKKDAKTLLDIITSFQVAFAREDGKLGKWSKLRSFVSDTNNIDINCMIDRAIEWSIVHALVSSAFPYARGTDDNIKCEINRRQAERALALFEFCSDYNDAYQSRLLYYENGNFRKWYEPSRN